MSICFPDKAHSTPGTFGIVFDCTWDIEHGVGVLVKNLKVKEVGLSETGFFVNE